jgi:bacterioferritin-associated ferredoxin
MISPSQEEPSMYVCLCHGISEKRLQQAIVEGARSFEQLQSCTGVATCCGACEPCAREMLGTQQQTLDSCPPPTQAC